MFRRSSFGTISVVLILISFGASAQAELSHRLALAGGFDARLVPDAGGHGYGLIAYDLEGLPAESHLGVAYNTDTIRVGFDRVRLASGYLEAGVHAAYEFVFAGLLTDYFRQGVLDPGRSFNAGYLAFDAYLKGNLPRDNYIELNVGFRRWFFDRNDGTDDMLVLPLETWVIEPRLRYTFWRLSDDPSLREAHRPFPRVRGAAFGVEVGLDLRTDSRPWGAIDEEQFTPVDPRNQGEPVVMIFRQWLRAGWQVHDRVRIQFAQFSGAGQGEDDLTRVRMGGLNPYVIPLAGAPWAGVVAGSFIAAELSLHIRIWREMEVGVLADGGAIDDIDRDGSLDYRLVGGLGAFADLRIGSFQIDLRGGWTPSLREGMIGNWNVLIAFGWQWSRT